MIDRFTEDSDTLDRRRAISKEYKERKRIGGVYKITDTVNGRYLISHAAHLASVRSHFQFAVMTGSAVHPKVKKDWDAFGPQAFTLEVVEELEQGPEQRSAEFLHNLKTLEHLCRAQLDASKAYSMPQKHTNTFSCLPACSLLRMSERFYGVLISEHCDGRIV